VAGPDKRALEEEEEGQEGEENKGTREESGSGEPKRAN